MSKTGPIAGITIALMVSVQPGAQRSEVLVSAAVSLSDVMQEAARAYEAQEGEHVVLNLAASNVLARQITAGARIDLFVSADELQMDAVAAEIVPGTRVDLVSNRLAVAVGEDFSPSIASAGDLSLPSIRRIAIGDPAAVPAGIYARRYLEQIGLWEELWPKIVPAGSVRLALAAVESGSAEAALVYETDVAVARRARLAFVVPQEEGPAIMYAAAVVRSGDNRPGARRFLAFLSSTAGAAIFAGAGFLPVTR